MTASATSPKANPADLGASTVVRPDERCMVLLVGGSSARAGELRDMLGQLEGYGLGVRATFRTPDGIKTGFGSEPTDLSVEGTGRALDKARAGAVAPLIFNP